LKLNVLTRLKQFPPKPPSLFPRLSLIPPKLIQVLEGKLGIGKPIPLLDDLSVEERKEVSMKKIQRRARTTL